MKIFYPIFLSILAAVGNAMVAYGQRKAIVNFNPYLFGAGSLLLASIILFTIGNTTNKSSIIGYIKVNYLPIVISAIDLSTLNVFLIILYQRYGTGYYTLYSSFAILTTSIVLAIYIFKEEFNLYYLISTCFAFVTIIFFMKGKMGS